MAGISRTRMLQMQNQGDPIFGIGTLIGLAGRGIARLGGALFKRGAKRAQAPLRGVAIPGIAGGVVGLAKSRTTQLMGLIRGGAVSSRGRRIAVGAAGAVAAGAAFEGGSRLVRLADGSVVEVPKRRRMNVLNPKALRRSTRRLAGFNREAKKVQRELAKLAPPRSRRSAGQVHVRGTGITHAG